MVGCYAWKIKTVSSEDIVSKEKPFQLGLLLVNQFLLIFLMCLGLSFHVHTFMIGYHYCFNSLDCDRPICLCLQVSFGSLEALLHSVLFGLLLISSLI